MPSERERSGQPVFRLLPAVEPEMQYEGCGAFDEEIAVVGQDVEGGVGAPMPRSVFRSFAPEVLLDGIQQLEWAALLSGVQKLQELSVRPHEWHGSARWFSGLQAELGQRSSIPYLFGQEATRPGHPCHSFEVG